MFRDIVFGEVLRMRYSDKPTYYVRNSFLIRWIFSTLFRANYIRIFSLIAVAEAGGAWVVAVQHHSPLPKVRIPLRSSFENIRS